MDHARSTTAADIVISGRLRRAREEAGLSQQALAQRCGITFQQIQKYEKAANRIAASRLIDVAVAVDRPLAYFLDGFGPAPEAITAPPPKPKKSATAVRKAKKFDQRSLPGRAKRKAGRRA